MRLAARPRFDAQQDIRLRLVVQNRDVTVALSAVRTPGVDAQ